jgi:hypothetical protein
VKGGRRGSASRSLTETREETGKLYFTVIQGVPVFPCASLNLEVLSLVGCACFPGFSLKLEVLSRVGFEQFWNQTDKTLD